MQGETKNYYDLLIDEWNDPVLDPPPLQDYMNKWDGQIFMDKLNISKDMSVLEIGVGTGRLALKIAPLCKWFVGIDLSPKTVERATVNLSNYGNISIICGDFLDTKFNTKFDVIYSSLTFMHIEEKQLAIEKVKQSLNDNGRFVLSIDKSQDAIIDMGSRKIRIYPDNPKTIQQHLLKAGLTLIEIIEIEFAYIIIALN
jgi:hypothetical protein